jgi:hypothetical protein
VVLGGLVSNPLAPTYFGDEKCWHRPTFGAVYGVPTLATKNYNVDMRNFGFIVYGDEILK